MPPDSAFLICLLQNVIYGRSVFFTFASLTDRQTVWDIPKQHRKKKTKRKTYRHYYSMVMVSIIFDCCNDRYDECCNRRKKRINAMCFCIGPAGREVIFFRIEIRHLQVICCKGYKMSTDLQFSVSAKIQQPSHQQLEQTTYGQRYWRKPQTLCKTET